MTELDRVLSNPSNLLMSDALEGVIDPHLLEGPTVWDGGDFRCYLEFIEFTLSGTLQSFSLNHKQKVIGVLVSSADAIKLLTGNFLMRYHCCDITGDLIFEESIDAEVSLKVRFQENNSALVSVVVKLIDT